MPDHLHVSRTEDLASLCDRIREYGAFALDMEFESERTYWPKLQLVQVAVDGQLALVDPLASLDLDPLWELTSDPAITKITHAGRQDAEIIFNESGAPPREIFDTQIAAAMLGMGEQIGYANLVQQVAGTRLKKAERVTDWGRRPLTKGQIRYALDDVAFLPRLHHDLTKQLEDLGRMGWVEEELGFYEDPSTYGRDPDFAYLKVSGRKPQDRRCLGVLRELARWREEEAARRNEPRGRIVSDDVLLEICVRRPERVEDLKPLRRLHPRELGRSGDALIAAVQRGLSLPEDELPALPKGLPDDPRLTLIAHFLDVLVRIRAHQHRIAPSYLSNQKGLKSLVDWLAGRVPQERQPRILSGWRRELVGDDLLELFHGRLAMRVNPDQRLPVTVETDKVGDGEDT